jgi:hypoxanthine phosphoribosyltransferase
MTQVDEFREASPPDSPAPERRLPIFAHASEAELARIFDFYDVRWEYEPHVFPLQWNLDGVVVESFTPDFFLPDLELYVELTTLRQPLVRKKNRKLRRLRELYPDVRIKLLYARDFRALMLKYGKVALVGALSGSSGQVVPPGAGEPGTSELGSIGPAPAVEQPIDAAAHAEPGAGVPAARSRAPRAKAARAEAPT